MLTGRRLFDGKSTSHVLVHVMEQEPDWSALPPLPEGVLGLLQRCLQKDRNQRLRDIGDVRIQLQGSQTNPIRVPEAAAGTAKTSAALVVARGRRRGRYRRCRCDRRDRLSAAGASRRSAAALQFEIARPEAFASSVLGGDFAGRPAAGLRGDVQGEPARLWVRSLETQEARPLGELPGLKADRSGRRTAAT